MSMTSCSKGFNDFKKFCDEIQWLVDSILIYFINFNILFSNPYSRLLLNGIIFSIDNDLNIILILPLHYNIKINNQIFLILYDIKII